MSASTFSAMASNFFSGIFFEFDDQDGAGIALYEEPVLRLFDIILCTF